MHKSVSGGQTLQAVAAEYRTDYLSLYSTNVNLENPDRVPQGTLINLGVMYRVKEGDRYVCMYVCLYECMYVCMCVLVYTLGVMYRVKEGDRYVCMYVCLYVCAYLCIRWV
jgi:hypothetical protein